MKPFVIILMLITTPLWMIGQTGKITTEKYREDFNYFWKSINDEYSYFGKKQTDWQKVREIYNPGKDRLQLPAAR
ncbi:MAG TPA: hypothetical protein VIV35_05730 [Chitinophagaceae bacterium]